MSEILNLENAPQPEDRPKMTRAESLAAARAVKAAKKAAGEVVDPSGQSSTRQPPEVARLVFWEKAFLAAMSNFAVKSPQGLDACVPIARRAVEIWEYHRKGWK